MAYLVYRPPDSLLTCKMLQVNTEIMSEMTKKKTNPQPRPHLTKCIAVFSFFHILSGILQALPEFQKTEILMYMFFEETLLHHLCTELEAM